MKNYKALIAALIGIIALSSFTSGIEISVSSNAGGFTEVIDAGFVDRVSGSTVIGSDRLSNSVQGNANLKESHSVSNTAGATAEVGVDIRNAGWYSYSYDLWPGQGSNWKAAKYPQVAASEDLDVLNASYIQAYADAFNSKGYRAGVSTVISDPGNEASIMGYSNLAMASKNEAFASQTADWAFSPDGYIQAETSADFTQMKSKPLRFSEDKAESKISVDSGFVEGYSDLASASALGVTASQQIDAATGEQIQTGTLASARTASLFQGLKAERAKVNKEMQGSLTGYNASAESRDGSVEADQTGQIIGSFTGTTTAGSTSKTRSSNYGDIYDFAMQARKDSSGSYASGNIGYYVDNVSPTANRIQGAVDAAESGDNINVATGMYFENVQIDKSLTIKGSGSGNDPVTDTIVDGGQNGSVFTIGQINPEVEVYLQSMTIQNGSGTDISAPFGYLETFGGGIWNQGILHLMSILISSNDADYGGGIFNNGTVNLSGGNITRNSADVGGGIYNWDGTVNIAGGNITGNNVNYFGGGGIFNGDGTVNIIGGDITGNNANEGSGIHNRDGTVNIYGGSISGNDATVGGGIFNSGTMNLFGGSIDHNSAYEGGGIYNSGTLNIDNTSPTSSPSISYNNADNGQGGGINNAGTMNMLGGSIDYNSAYAGGGILNTGTLNIDEASPSSGPSISYNIAIDGGGLFNMPGGSVNLRGGSIGHNNANYGGGGIRNDGMLNIGIDNASPSNGPSISYNTADYGAGIFNFNNFPPSFDFGTVNLNSGSIDHNNATSPSPSGGGIYNLGSIYGNRSIVHDNTPDQIVNAWE